MLYKHFPVVITHISQDWARNNKPAREAFFRKLEKKNTLATVLCHTLVKGRPTRRCCWLIKCARREDLFKLLLPRAEGGTWTLGR